jgi:hypothetical protein
MSNNNHLVWYFAELPEIDDYMWEIMLEEDGLEDVVLKDFNRNILYDDNDGSEYSDDVEEG